MNKIWTVEDVAVGAEKTQLTVVRHAAPVNEAHLSNWVENILNACDGFSAAEIIEALERGRK